MFIGAAIYLQGVSQRRLRYFKVASATHAQVFWIQKKLPSQFNKDCLHCVFPFPLGEAGKLIGVDYAVARVDTRQVNLANELNGGRLIGVFVAAVHLDTVDAVLVDRL